MPECNDREIPSNLFNGHWTRRHSRDGASLKGYRLVVGHVRAGSSPGRLTLFLQHWKVYNDGRRDPEPVWRHPSRGTKTSSVDVHSEEAGVGGKKSSSRRCKGVGGRNRRSTRSSSSPSEDDDEDEEEDDEDDEDDDDDDDDN